MNLKPGFKPIDPHKSLINIGATFDIPTSYWMRGIYGENIMLGGLGPLTAISGPGKMYKSTVLHYQMLSAMARVWTATKTSCSTYDSETNIHVSRMKQFVKMFPEFGDTDIIDGEDWVISDSGTYYGDEWWSKLRTFMIDKRKNAKQLQVRLPFNDKHGNPIFETVPTFSEIDSLTAMQLSAGVEILNKNDIGDSGGSHVFMREGLGKAQMLHELPAMGASCKHYFLTTTHIGKNNQMSSGPGMMPPKKQLQFLDPNTKVKGVTEQFLYQQHNFWMVTNCVLLWNKEDKTPKYPKVQGDAAPGDTDLNLVTVQNMRSNSGPNGYKLDIIVSQAEGVLPSLTEFNMLKDYDSFGFDGNDRSYRLFLMPEETLQRTTVREKLDRSPRLRRAMNITSEIAQMQQFQMRFIGDRIVQPDVLATKLKERGYDLNWLLDNTRGWWTYNNERVGSYFLSTLDLMDMANGLYHPYWLQDDCKTVKKEFLRENNSLAHS